MIDLRSDTLTRPTAAMRRAKAFARHGVRALGSGDRVRLVVHLDITDRDIEEAARSITDAVTDLGCAPHSVVTSSV